MKVTGIGGLVVQPNVQVTNDYGKQGWVVSGQIAVRGRLSTHEDICNFTYKMFTQKQADYNVKKMNMNAGLVFMGDLTIVGGIPTIEINEIIEHTSNNYYFAGGLRGAAGASNGGGYTPAPTAQIQAQQNVRPTITPQNNGVPTFPPRNNVQQNQQVQQNNQYSNQQYPTGMPVIDLNSIGQ